MAHANICNTTFEPPYQCSEKFSTFFRHSHFIADVGVSVYKLNDLSQKETYMNRKLVAFFEDLDFVNNVASSRVAPRKIIIIHRDMIASGSYYKR